MGIWSDVGNVGNKSVMQPRPAPKNESPADPIIAQAAESDSTIVVANFDGHKQCVVAGDVTFSLSIYPIRPMPPEFVISKGPYTDASIASR